MRSSPALTPIRASSNSRLAVFPAPMMKWRSSNLSPIIGSPPSSSLCRSAIITSPFSSPRCTDFSVASLLRISSIWASISSSVTWWTIAVTFSFSQFATSISGQISNNAVKLSPRPGSNSSLAIVGGPTGTRPVSRVASSTRLGSKSLMTFPLIDSP